MIKHDIKCIHIHKENNNNINQYKTLFNTIELKQKYGINIEFYVNIHVFDAINDLCNSEIVILKSYSFFGILAGILSKKTVLFVPRYTDTENVDCSLINNMMTVSKMNGWYDSYDCLMKNDE